MPTYKTHRLATEGSDVVEESPRRPHAPGAAHPRRAARHRHRRGSARPAARPTTSSAPSPTDTAGVMPVDVVTGDRDLLPARRRRATRSGCSTPARAGCATPTSSTQAVPAGAVRRRHRRGVRRHVGAARRHQRRPARGHGHRRQDGRPADRDLRLARRRCARPSTAATPRSRGRSAREPRGGHPPTSTSRPPWCACCATPTSPEVDLALPREVADPELLEQIGEVYGVANPVGRVLKALGLG